MASPRLSVSLTGRQTVSLGQKLTSLTLLFRNRVVFKDNGEQMASINQTIIIRTDIFNLPDCLRLRLLIFIL